MAGEHREQQDPNVRFEATDVPPLLPMWLAAGLGGCVLIVLLAITLGYPLADRQQYRGPMRPLPSEPRLQVAPAKDLVRYDLKKQRELQAGAVPIESAMRATARQGWGPPR